MEHALRWQMYAATETYDYYLGNYMKIRNYTTPQAEIKL